MARLVGTVVSGTGDLAQWMRKYRDAYRAATGVELVAGSLNVELDREYRFTRDDCVRLGPDEAGVGVSLLPCSIEGRPAYLFRTDRTEAGVGDHARTVVEVVAETHFREELGFRDGDRVEIVVSRSS